MKPIRAIMFLFLLAMSAEASIVNINMTNTFGVTATNSIKLTQVATNVQSDGTYLTIGTFKWYNSTNGLYSLSNLSTGNYKMEIQNVNQGPVVFAVPSGTNSYDVTNIWLSGYNIFNYTPGVFQLVNTDGSVILSPSNGKGTVTVSASGANTNYINQVGLNLTNLIHQYTPTNVFQGFTNLIRSAGFSNASQFQTSSTNLNGWAALNTNILSGVVTNLGTAAYSNATAFQPSSVNLSNLATVGTNNWTTTNQFKTFTNSVGTAAFSAASSFQPSTVNGTNWSVISTNQMLNTNVFNPFTNSLGNAAFLSQTNWQQTNGNLTGFAAFNTNFFSPDTKVNSLSNSLGSAAFLSRTNFQQTNLVLTALGVSGAITNAVGGTNVSVTLSNNILTINSSGGGASVLSGNYTTNINGTPTNLTAYTTGSYPIGFSDLGKSHLWGLGASAGGINYCPNYQLLFSWIGIQGNNPVVGFNQVSNYTMFNGPVYVPQISLGNQLSGPIGTITNWSQLTNGFLTSVVTNGFTTTNDFKAFTNTIGSAALVSSNLFQPSNNILTSFQSLGTNYAWPRTTALQPASVNLTNFALIQTNAFYNTNQNLQSGSLVLTNFVTLGTNAFFNRADNLQSGSQQLTNFVNIGTNGFIRTNIAVGKGSIGVFNGTIWVGLAAGTDGYVLTASSTTASGLSYTSSASGTYSGTGSPQSAVVAFVGNTYLDTATTNFYVKISGNGTTTGWTLLVQGTNP